MKNKRDFVIVKTDVKNRKLPVFLHLHYFHRDLILS